MNGFVFPRGWTLLSLLIVSLFLSCHHEVDVVVRIRVVFGLTGINTEVSRCPQRMNPEFSSSITSLTFSSLRPQQSVDGFSQTVDWIFMFSEGWTLISVDYLIFHLMTSSDQNFNFCKTLVYGQIQPEVKHELLMIVKVFRYYFGKSEYI